MCCDYFNVRFIRVYRFGFRFEFYYRYYFLSIENLGKLYGFLRIDLNRNFVLRVDIRRISDIIYFRVGSIIVEDCNGNDKGFKENKRELKSLIT